MKGHNTDLEVYTYSQYVNYRGNGGYGAVIEGTRVEDHILCANCAHHALSEVAKEEGSTLVLKDPQIAVDAMGNTCKIAYCDTWGKVSSPECLDK